MPVLENWDIDLEMIDILIKKEREEQNNAYERTFLQLPMPSYENFPKNEKNNEEHDIIVIDL